MTESKYLKIKTATGNGLVKHPPYYYAERLGVDSVAFVLHRTDNNFDEYGLIREYKPPIGVAMLSAFGGSLDKPHLTPLEIVIEECREEAGYSVTEDDVVYLGKRFVSTQMNQFCHLYMVDVGGLKQGAREPETYLEAQATVEWLPWRDICTAEFHDWKAQVILHSPRHLGVA